MTRKQSIIDKWMKKENLTRKQLADKLDKSERYVYIMLKNPRIQTLDEIILFAEVINQPVTKVVRELLK